MLALLSPAKNLNFDPAPGAPAPTKPALLKEAAALAATARALKPAQIAKLMSISAKLAELNHARFAAFRGDMKAAGAKHAVLAFNGDVYLGLDAKTLTREELLYAQDHVRILSGLYGILRPLDAIEPYRLEMGSKLKTPRGGDLYAWWGDRIAKELSKSLAAHQEASVVNLASAEYFGAVNAAALKAPVFTAVFREEKDGALRSLQFFAKRARGLMARWIVRNRIDRAADLRGFDGEGYRWRADLSAERTLVFTRPQPPLKNPPKSKD